MKNQFVFLWLAFVCIGVKAQTTYPSGATGCIARWTFDTTESATMLTSLPDVSNNNNPCTTNTIGSTNGFREKPNKAGNFNGSSSWAEAPHKTMLNPSNISIVSLVRFSNFNSANCQGNNIVYKGYNYNANLSWGQYVGETDNNCVQVSPTTEKLYFVSPNSVYTPPTNNYIQTSQWYLLVTVQDNNKVDYYQIPMDTSNHIANISITDTDNSPMPLGNSNDPVFIGVTQNPNYKYWFTGSIDEIAIFNKALNTSEVQGIYDYLWGYYPASAPSVIADNIQADVFYQEGAVVIRSVEEVEHIALYNLAGQCVYQKQNPEQKLYISTYPKGLYIAHLQTKKGSKTVKLPVFN